MVKEETILQYQSNVQSGNFFHSNQVNVMKFQPDFTVYDGYINWVQFMNSTKSINLLKQSFTLALDRMEI